MVRLKGFIQQDFSRTIAFQFHYGTIKRKNINGLRAPQDRRFNSIMVRLKEMKKELYCLTRMEVSIPLWYD